MQKNMQIYANICICPISLPQLHYMQKDAKNMHVYAKYVSMNLYA